MVSVTQPASAGEPNQSVLPDQSLDVTIVVPYYNPGARLRTTVEQMLRVLHASDMTFEIIAVSDGSTDGSPFTLEGFPESVVRRLEFDTNVGKGRALRVGLGLGRGRYLGFIDADGDISPEFLAPFVSIMRSQEADIIIGSKRHPGSSVHYPPLRHLYSWGYQHLIHFLFRLSVKDTQVGIKLVDGKVMADVLPLLRESRFALDLELLVLARQLGYTRIVEAPVRIEERFGSTISIKAVWSLLIDTLALFWRFRVRHAYDSAIAARPTAREALTSAARADRRGSVVQSPLTSHVRPGFTDGGTRCHTTRPQSEMSPSSAITAPARRPSPRPCWRPPAPSPAGARWRRARRSCDFEPEEISRQLSISTSLAPFTVNGVKVNLLDTPGYADFASEMLTALASVDLAVVVVSATDGVQAQTEDAWRAAAKLGLPRVIVINKLDRERADFDRTLAEIRQPSAPAWRRSSCRSAPRPTSTGSSTCWATRPPTTTPWRRHPRRRHRPAGRPRGPHPRRAGRRGARGARTAGRGHRRRRRRPHGALPGRRDDRLRRAGEEPGRRGRLGKLSSPSCAARPPGGRGGPAGPADRGALPHPGLAAAADRHGRHHHHRDPLRRRRAHPPHGDQDVHRQPHRQDVALQGDLGHAAPRHRAGQHPYPRARSASTPCRASPGTPPRRPPRCRRATSSPSPA